MNIATVCGKTLKGINDEQLAKIFITITYNYSEKSEDLTSDSSNIFCHLLYDSLKFYPFKNFLTVYLKSSVPNT